MLKRFGRRDRAGSDDTSSPDAFERHARRADRCALSRRNPFAFTPTLLLALTATLMGLGVVMVFSASATLTGETITWPLWKCRAVRQLLFAGMGFTVAIVVSMMPYRWLRVRDRSDGHRRHWLQPNVVLMIGTLALLALVLKFGTARNQSMRWFSVGPAGYDVLFQPSELAKVALVLFVAGWFGCRGVKPGRFFTGLLPPALVLGACLGLVGKEDFGTAALLMAVGGLMLVAAGTRLWQLLLLSVPALGAMTYLLVSAPYRWHRVVTFLHVWDDPKGAGYQAVQSLCSIAAGGWWGVGLGAGLQKYGYLPESRTDFIYGIICEELGIVGGLVVIALYMLFIWQGRKAAEAAPDAFGRLLALGVTLMIGLQAVINIAVVTVSVPTKGIALPMVSAGGSGALLMGASVGLLASVARAGSAWRDWTEVRYGLVSGLLEPVQAPELAVSGDG